MSRERPSIFEDRRFIAASRRETLLPFETAPGEYQVGVTSAQAAREIRMPLIEEPLFESTKAPFPLLSPTNGADGGEKIVSLALRDAPIEEQRRALARVRAQSASLLAEPTPKPCPPGEARGLPPYISQLLMSQDPHRKLQPDQPFSIQIRAKAPQDRIPLEIQHGEELDREIGSAAPRMFAGESYSERQAKIGSSRLIEGTFSAVENSEFSELHARIIRANLTPAQILRAGVLEAISQLDEHILPQPDREYIIKRLVQIPNAGNRNGAAVVLGFIAWRDNVKTSKLIQLMPLITQLGITEYDVIRHIRMWVDVMRLPEPLDQTSNAFASANFGGLVETIEHEIDDDLFEELLSDED